MVPIVIQAQYICNHCGHINVASFHPGDIWADTVNLEMIFDAECVRCSEINAITVCSFPDLRPL